jgi:hypothetical protein
MEADCLKIHAAVPQVNTTNGPAGVTYGRNGCTTDQGINFTLCDAEGAGITARSIAIELTGRPNITRQGDCA